MARDRRLRSVQQRIRLVREYLVVVAVAAMIEWSLRRESLPRTARRARVRLLEQTTVEPPSTLHPSIAHRMAIVDSVYRRWPFGDTCLRRAMVLGHRLAWLHPEIVVGARIDGGRVTAHAWVRVSGVDLDPTAADYVEFLSESG